MRYPIGSLVFSVNGEMDCDNEDIERHTGPNAWGDIRDYDASSGYSIVFTNGTWIHLDEHELDDRKNYDVCSPAAMAHRLMEIRAIDDGLNTAERAPDGDDYNAIHSIISA